MAITLDVKVFFVTSAVVFINRISRCKQITLLPPAGASPWNIPENWLAISELNNTSMHVQRINDHMGYRKVYPTQEEVDAVALIKNEEALIEYLRQW